MNGLTDLQDACFENNTTKVREILSLGVADVNVRFPETGLTPLMVAVLNDNEEIVCLLLSNTKLTIDDKSHLSNFNAMEYAKIKRNHRIINAIKERL